MKGRDGDRPSLGPDTGDTRWLDGPGRASAGGRRPDESQVEFHDDLPDPTRAFFDFRENDVADEEMGLRISELEPLGRL